MIQIFFNHQPNPLPNVANTFNATAVISRRRTLLVSPFAGPLPGLLIFADQLN